MVLKPFREWTVTYCIDGTESQVVYYQAKDEKDTAEAQDRNAPNADAIEAYRQACEEGVANVKSISVEEVE